MQKLVLYFLLMIVLLTGCRALPERNYVGMTRNQVIESVAETPKAWEKDFHISVSAAPHEQHANVNLYFKTIDGIRKDRLVRDAKMLGVYYQSHWSGFTFYYELTLKDDIVVRQRIVSYSDGITLLPIRMFYDYPGERQIKK